MPVERTLEWQEWALCADIDPELWFPEKGKERDYVTAKRICDDCPAQPECLDYALERERASGELGPTWIFGMWGGTRPAERYRMHLEWRRANGDHTATPFGVQGGSEDERVSAA